VLDEYGGASGIVSLENITEELFGPIQDEFDRERQEIEELPDGRLRVRGDYLIEDLADRLHADVGEPAEETIGGYVAAQLGGKTAPGMTLELGQIRLEVVEAKGFRVRWVIAQKRGGTAIETEEKQG
jgi:CBS domain containing-hemolysin-like protein